MIRVKCDVEPEHFHEFEDDWQFAGPLGTDWRADPRWVPTVYIYLDDHLRSVWHTTEPRCLDDALDKFTNHRDFKPVYLQYALVGQEAEIAPFKYDPDTDLLEEIS
jgi:hypothetical protein